jgi:subtilisin family serine protease
MAGIALSMIVGASIALPAAVSAAGPVAPHASTAAGATVGALLVKLRSDVSWADGSRLIAASGARQIGGLAALSTRVVDVPLAQRWTAMRKLASDPRVVSIQSDATVSVAVEPNDAMWNRQWGQRKVRAPIAWGMSTGDRSVIIAIVDTGVDADQPDLAGRVMRGHDFHNNDSRANDDNGHGTAVAGVAAAAGNNRVGIAGMCWKCRILPVKVLNANGSGSHSNIAAGIIWAVGQGADVINLSLASMRHTEVLADAVAYARRKGAVVVAAAGNEGSKRKFYPAALPGVISVAASNSADRLYSWSNDGSWIKLAAPGCALTTKRGRSWSYWCGTSFATPYVAGTVALVASEHPKMGRTALEASVLGTAAGLRGVIRGRLDALRALRSAN